MADSEKISTEKLLAMLFKERNIELILQRDESSFLLPSFGEYMTDWCRKNSQIPEQVILRAHLDKSYGHQLFNGKRNPSRDTVMQLAFAIQADLPQAQEMLKIARKSILYPRVKRDAVIIYCLFNRISLADARSSFTISGCRFSEGKTDERNQKNNCRYRIGFCGQQLSARFSGRL